MTKMRNIKLKRMVGVIFIFTSWLFASTTALGWEVNANREARIAPVLRDEAAFLKANPQYDYEIPVIITVRRDYFQETADRHRNLDRREAGEIRSLNRIRSYAARVLASRIGSLADVPAVEYVTLDARIFPTGSTESLSPAVDLADLRSVLGADQVGAKGQGVTVAVFDSGIDSHHDLRRKQRLKASVDFTSGSPELQYLSKDTDDFGHGTHVAGIIGGTGRLSNGVQEGIAPAVSFVDVKVVGDEGWGYTSNLIQAIEWVVENQENYDIRVANMSIGHPAYEEYFNDPLCIATEEMVARGIVTVVSAGNLGRTEEHPKIWGGIYSPGTDPTVITVYPVNTHGTLTHQDDSATTYGSK